MDLLASPTIFVDGQLMRVDVPGPAGILQAELSESAPVNGRYAVLCHPHPQYGGSMHDTVLDILARVFESHGVACLRFNFRGVGASTGSHDGNGGEVDDLLAAIDWLNAEHAPEGLTLAGYSFGANMIWRALDSLDTPQRVVLVAPPVGLMEFAPRELGCPVDVFVGDVDEFVDARALAAWEGVRIHTIPGADHFFAGKWKALEAEIEAAVQ
jgi:alpha/beta superfamily hydrolase